MANLVKWIEEMSNGEKIDGVVISGIHNNEVICWNDAKPFLNYDFDDDYGYVECHAICAWTKSWVIAVSAYDGSTEPFRIPRHPTKHVPIMPGGGG